MERIRVSKLSKGLLITAVAVITLSSLASWFGFRATNGVSERTKTLVTVQIPHLRSISALQDQVSRRMLGLYLYYATLEPSHWEAGVLLANSIGLQLSEISDLLNDQAQNALNTYNNKLTLHADAFHEEMSKGSARNWDTLREHLANAQTEAGMIDQRLLALAERIRREVRDESSLTTVEVTQLTSTQIAVSLVMLVVVLVTLWFLRARARDQAELFERAYFDRLTGLPNRRCFEEQWAAHDSLYQASIIIKLNHYQLFIGTYGQDIVNQIVLLVAERMQRAISMHKASASLFQLAPATWLIHMEDDEQRNGSALLSEMIMRMSLKPLNVGDREFTVTECLGVTHYPDHADSAESLLLNAETAVRVSLQEGKACTVYEEQMRTSSEQFLAVETAMRKGLHNNEFELFYQPKINAADLSCSGSEALVRWRKNGSLVSPGEFVPVAEESGFILTLGRWVLEEACRQWKEWQSQGITSLPVAVNVSAQQFQSPGFVDLVESTLARFSIPQGVIELEITEEATFGDPENIIDTLKALRKTGVTLAIDDFGTGYSSLAYLKKFPVQVLKIDQAFIKDMGGSARDLSIVNMMVMLGKKFDFKIVAEGVETQYQQEHLQSIGCDFLQGYLYSKPLSADAFPDYLIRQNTRVA